MLTIKIHIVSIKQVIWVFALLVLTSCSSQKEPVDYVNPMLGTSSSRWMLFPGATMPFGMVKLSPDNTDNTKYGLGAGYEFKINSVSGFGHVHSWMMGSFLMMPVTGELKILPGTKDDPDSGYRSRINHNNEKASPGYYSVLLDDYGIKAELTTTTRCGFQRYTFPKTESGRILFDLQVPEEEEPNIVEASIKKVSDTEIEGYIKREAGEWNEYTIHFVAVFNHPFSTMGGWKDSKIINETNEIKISENMDVGAFLNFSLNDEQTILVKTGISYVSMEQAHLNLKTEMDKFAWDFDAAHDNARNTWNKLLNKIKVEGGSETDKLKFYTGMYRSYCSKTIFSDVNGKYVDACENIQQINPDDFSVYGADAFWGSFWNINQLWSLASPDVSEKWIKSLLELYDKNGWLHDAPGGLEYASIMVAAHQVPFIVNAYQKGIRGYDAEKAYKAIKEIQMNPGRPYECGGYVGNRNLQTYMDIGYVPANEGPVSNTLEYAYDDWCVAQMAKSLGKTDDYEYFMKRAQNYRNVFDKSIGYVRPKHRGGPWLEDFDPKAQSGSKAYVEANAWQFSWFVPHDLKGLIELMGVDEFNDRLEKGFENSRPYFSSDFVNHGNQPNMEAPWLFNYSGKPWLTQYWVREVLDNYYGTDPVDGYHGDEDQGQMGAWYVMSAIGLFEMDGGSAVEPVYELSGPIFEKITIQLDSNYYPGKEFIIEAKNTSAKNRYIQSATLNGKKLNKFWFKHSELVKGGKLVLEMGAEPNKNWPENMEHPQITDIKPIVSTPYIIDTKRTFNNENTVKLACDTKDAEIYYTTNGSEADKTANLYTKPFIISKTTIVKMKAYKAGQESLASSVEIKKTGLSKKVYLKELKPGVKYKYTHGIYRMVYDFKDAKVLKSGILPNFTSQPKEKELFFSFDFEAFINIPKDGEYTFYINSNDGGRLYIDDYLLLNNDGLHGMTEVSKTIKLKAGLHPISVKYFQEGGSNGLEVSWQSPGFEKQIIPPSVLFYKPN